jgi:hypothetical protein
MSYTEQLICKSQIDSTFCLSFGIPLRSYDLCAILKVHLKSERDNRSILISYFYLQVSIHVYANCLRPDHCDIMRVWTFISDATSKMTKIWGG